MLPLIALALLHPQAPAPDVTALFHEHCASCHGETGDGKGWAELDRQARSFKEGGFSFGNTPETILRTITHGIPGTPMPGFDTALTEEQRKALALHVIALGPPDMASEPTNTEMVVLDRPLIARGHLPPIVDGAEPRARGLLIGTLEGLTFEYRTDDVRLLGVRSGAFCERSDWTGRGGTPLRPLGKLVLTLSGGDPPPTFHAIEDALSVHLRAELRSTFISDDRAGLECALLDAGGAERARVREIAGARVSKLGLVLTRELRIQAGSSQLRLRVRVADPCKADEDVTMNYRATGATRVVTRADGSHLVLHVQVEDGATGNGEVDLELAAGDVRTLRVEWLFTEEWTAEMASEFEEEVAR